MNFQKKTVDKQMNKRRQSDGAQHLGSATFYSLMASVPYISAMFRATVPTLMMTIAAALISCLYMILITPGAYTADGPNCTPCVAERLTCVDVIYSTSRAFAAKKTDGTVVTWGDPYSGGDSSFVAANLTSVDVIYSTRRAFAAKKTDGTVVTWGDHFYGGDSSLVATNLTSVDAIYSTRTAFAAKKTDGTVVTWGH